MQINAQIEIEPSLTKRLLALTPQSLSSLLDTGQAVLLNRIRTRFLAEQGIESAWIPSKSSLIRRAGGYTWSHGRKWTGTGTLYASGTLFHSIYAYKTSNLERHIGVDEKRAPYVTYLHDRWPFLGANAQDKSIFIAVLQSGISRQLFD